MLANVRQQRQAEEAERQRQAALAAKNEHAIAIKEHADQQRFENVKAKADWEQKQRESYNVNSGYLWHGRWYSY